MWTGAPVVLEAQEAHDVHAVGATDVGSNVDARVAANAGSTHARFATAVQLQKDALAAPDPAAQRAGLDRAEAIFAQEVDAGVRPGAALNNLAVIAANKGDTAAARGYFDRALATDDPNRAFYALNYSKLLESTHKTEALRLARTAVGAAPDSIAANAQLGRLLAQTSPAELLPFAATLMDRGHTDLATQFAMQNVTLQSRPPEERAAWLILIASRAAREYGTSDDARTALVADIATLEQDPDLGAASRQLRAAIVEAPLGTSAVEWWRGRYQPPQKSRTSGRDAMRAVLVAAGEYRTANGDRVGAERYFATAVDLGARGPDPDAFLRLVELYASNHETAKLTNLMDRHQFELFSEKSEAYARNDWPLVYRMHVALGMTYAHLEVWQSTMPYQNAIFQLTNAMRAAEQIARAAQQKGWERIALPPVAIDELARGYTAIGQADLATKAQIEGADALRSIGHLPDSRAVLKSISAEALTRVDGSLRAKYEGLRAALEP